MTTYRCEQAFETHPAPWYGSGDGVLRPTDGAVSRLLRLQAGLEVRALLHGRGGAAGRYLHRGAVHACELLNFNSVKY